MRYCIFCGIEIPADAKYCQICGKAQPSEVEKQENLTEEEPPTTTNLTTLLNSPKKLMIVGIASFVFVLVILTFIMTMLFNH